MCSSFESNRFIAFPALIMSSINELRVAVLLRERREPS